jgi:long-chain acyl-CoA synthetase
MRTALDVFAERVAASGDRVALRRKAEGTWRTTSWKEVDERARLIAAGLIDLGVRPGDRVVILGTTRPEWVECDLGILMTGGVTVPIYPSNTPDQCQYIVDDCGAAVIIVEDDGQRAKLGGRGKVVQWEKGPPNSGVRTLDALCEAGKLWLDRNPGKLDGIADEVLPDQAATFIYTSGTTGPPKGVVLTHANLEFECAGVKDLLGLTPEDEQMLFLPLAHVFAKVLVWASISIGASIAFAESTEKLVANMQEVKPTFMGAVPRVYEKAYGKIQANLEAKRKKFFGRKIIDWAMKKGRARPPGCKSIGLADKLVFKKVQATFGGRMRFFISGGAPLSREIAEFFHTAGLLVLEGYGLTETTAATHVNRPDDYRFGTVGPAIPGVDVKIAGDGEILVRGGNIMKEYYGKPEATAEAIGADGWFHTGDIGVIDDDGKLRITDRKKDLIITAGGKNVAPQNLENDFKARCQFVSQVMVYGDQRKYLSALITLAEENVRPWAQQHGLDGKSMAELAAAPEVIALIQKALDDLNAALPSYETIKKFTILPRDFDQESGEMTPTLKVKRKFVTEKYRELLDRMYDA